MHPVRPFFLGSVLKYIILTIISRTKKGPKIITEPSLKKQNPAGGGGAADAGAADAGGDGGALGLGKNASQAFVHPPPSSSVLTFLEGLQKQKGGIIANPIPSLIIIATSVPTQVCPVGVHMGTRYIEMSWNVNLCSGWVTKDERANVHSTAIMRESLSWVPLLTLRPVTWTQIHVKWQIYVT